MGRKYFSKSKHEGEYRSCHRNNVTKTSLTGLIYVLKMENISSMFFDH